MSQSLSQVILHVVFSTKDRRPWLDQQIQPRLHSYLSTLCRDSGCQAYRVGGAHDHVHIAARLGRTTTQADLLESIKKKSSTWMKSQAREYQGFFWQGGYGAFSIGWSQLEDLVQYIDNQEQHHKSYSFQEEYLALLKKYRVEFDERFLWD
jgi:REP element-mobilizing transposase RayT